MIRRALAALALAFALAHVPYTVSTLEDIDSVNFALGVRDFDVAEHRPHPPGYPVYIALGKAGVAVARLFDSAAPDAAIEARSLSLLALLGGIVAIIALYRVFAAMSAGNDVDDLVAPPWRALDARSLAATALAASCPLFWYLASRPMSDVPGLAAALASQACLALAWWRQGPTGGGDRRLTPDRMEASGRMIVLGALLAGLSIGFRSQNAMLTVPLLFGVLLDRIGRGVAGAMLGAGVAFGVGMLAWAVPLIIASGGLNAYLAALGSQAGEDFAGVEMLYLNPSNVRLLAFALVRTLIYPWDSIPLGGIVVVLATIGSLVLLLRDRRTLAAVMLLSLPYLLFHLLFHDTTFVRYALPIVPAVAFLAVTGLAAVARQGALPIAGALALWCVSIAGPTLAEYASAPSPVARALESMRNAAEAAPPDAWGMHQTFRRPWQAEDRSAMGAPLDSPPRREWLELTKFWRAHPKAEVWFLADPRRSDLALVDPRSRENRFDFIRNWSSLNELGGIRPSSAHWYRMPAPGWFAEEGWALTPETAGIARLMGRGPSLEPITAWVRERPEALHVMVGGRHLGSAGDPGATFIVSMNDVDVESWEVPPGFFLHDFVLPAGTASGEGLAALRIRSISGIGGRAETAVEQFDVQTAGTLMWGYDTGWHEAEFDPAIGVWRWTSDRATLRILGASTPVAVTLRVERPSRYFDEPLHVQLQAADTVIGETTFADSETWTVVVPLELLDRAGGRIAVVSNRTFVPAARSGGPDERALALRVFDVNIAAQH